MSGTNNILMVDVNTTQSCKPINKDLVHFSLLFSFQVFLRRTATPQHTAVQARRDGRHQVALRQAQAVPVDLQAEGQWWTLRWTTHQMRKRVEGGLGTARTQRTARTAQHPRGADTIMTKILSLRTETGCRYGQRDRGHGFSSEPYRNLLYPIVFFSPKMSFPKILIQTYEHMHKLLTSGAGGHPHDTTGNP